MSVICCKCGHENKTSIPEDRVLKRGTTPAEPPPRVEVAGTTFPRTSVDVGDPELASPLPWVAAMIGNVPNIFASNGDRVIHAHATESAKGTPSQFFLEMQAIVAAVNGEPSPLYDEAPFRFIVGRLPMEREDLVNKNEVVRGHLHPYEPSVEVCPNWKNNAAKILQALNSERA